MNRKFYKSYRDSSGSRPLNDGTLGGPDSKLRTFTPLNDGRGKCIWVVR